ncbi:MAG TPA: hypothetical protein PKD54_07370 [Pirellulaceae bacterium]|nr:hypothetical protein [Pirellulaceae bacterium]
MKTREFQAVLMRRPRPPNRIRDFCGPKNLGHGTLTLAWLPVNLAPMMKWLEASRVHFALRNIFGMTAMNSRIRIVSVMLFGLVIGLSRETAAQVNATIDNMGFHFWSSLGSC